MRKLHLSLLKDQKKRGVYFSSTLSPYRFETTETTRHEITKKEYLDDYKSAVETESRLKKDSFL